VLPVVNGDGDTTNAHGDLAVTGSGQRREGHAHVLRCLRDAPGGDAALVVVVPLAWSWDGREPSWRPHSSSQVSTSGRLQPPSRCSLASGAEGRG